jgi:hypothetical protein
MEQVRDGNKVCLIIHLQQILLRQNLRHLNPVRYQWHFLFDINIKSLINMKIINQSLDRNCSSIFGASSDNFPPSPVIFLIRISFVLLNSTRTSSPGESIASPITSKPQARFATVAGAKTLILFSNSSLPYLYSKYLLILMISAKTPAAVTSAPAPGPFTTNGRSVYLSVVNEIILSLPDKL